MAKPLLACGHRRDPAYLPPELASDLCAVCDLADLIAAIERNQAELWRRQHPITLPREPERQAMRLNPALAAGVQHATRSQACFLG